MKLGVFTQPGSNPEELSVSICSLRFTRQRTWQQKLITSESCHVWTAPMARVGCPDRRIERLALRAVRPPNLHITPDDGAISSRRKRDGFLIALTFGHHGPSHPRELVGERDRGNLRWSPCQQRRKPTPVFSAMDLGIADHRKRTGCEQTAQVAIALFADTAGLVLAPTRVVPGSSYKGGSRAKDQQPKGRQQTICISFVGSAARRARPPSKSVSREILPISTAYSASLPYFSPK